MDIDQIENIIASGADALTLNANDTVIVEQGIVVSGDSDHMGITAAGFNHITVKGTVSGVYGIYEPDGGGSSTFDIDTSGTVAGRAEGLFLQPGSIVNNHGFITSGGFGIDFRQPGDVTVTNFGTIKVNDETALYFGDIGTHTVINSGLITTGDGLGDYAIQGNVVSGIEKVTNTGTIHGKLMLGGGADYVDTHLGTIQGLIDLREGNDTAYGSAQADSILGGDNNDRLIGNNGYDTLVGGENDDTMDGGLGKDRLDGGNGADAFRFSTALSPSNVDLIVGFSHADDRIQLDSTVFSALGLTVTNSEFHINASGHGAGTSVVRLILDDSTHTLWYDDDGSGTHAAVQVCGFSGMVGTLAFDDFVI